MVPFACANIGLAARECLKSGRVLEEPILFCAFGAIADQGHGWGQDGQSIAWPSPTGSFKGCPCGSVFPYVRIGNWDPPEISGNREPIVNKIG